MIIEVTRPKRINKAASVDNETLFGRIEAAKSAKRDKWVVVDFRIIAPKQGEDFARAEERAGRALRSSQRYLLKRLNAHYNLDIPGQFPSATKVMRQLDLDNATFTSEIEGKSAVVWAARRQG